MDLLFEHSNGVLEDLHELWTHVESLAINLDGLPNIPIIMTFGAGVPVTKHLNDVNQAHATYAALMALRMVRVVDIVVVEGRFHLSLHGIELWRTICGAGKFIRVEGEVFNFRGFEL